MDIVYHRNCLDGVYSGYLLYMASRVLGEEEIAGFVEKILRVREETGKCQLQLEKIACLNNQKYA